MIETHGARALGFQNAEKLTFHKFKGMMRPLLIDYLQHLLAVSRLKTVKSKIISMGISEEEKNEILEPSDITLVISGGFFFDRDSLIVTYQNENGVTVPLAGASSGVAQLVALLFSLPSKLNDFENIPFIVVEEPEINLHANHQLKVTTLLAKIARFTNLIVTTHSEYVLQKFAHLLAENQIDGLKVYFIDPKTHKASLVGLKKETGEIELLCSIDEAVESLAGEGICLMEKSNVADDSV